MKRTMTGLLTLLLSWFSPSLSVLANGSLAQAQLCEQAKQVSVKVYNQNRWGSGVLIQRHNNLYTLVTNGHVLNLNTTTHTIETWDRSRYTANVIARFDQKESANHTDLAVLQFTTPPDGPIYNLANLADWNSETEVMATGFPGRPVGITDGEGFICTDFSRVSSVELPVPMQGGVELGYFSSVQNGMSGGGIFDRFGRVVGLNTRGEPAIFSNPDLYLDHQGKRMSELLAMNERINEQQALNILETTNWGISANRIVSLLPSSLGVTLLDIPSPSIAISPGILPAAPTELPIPTLADPDQTIVPPTFPSVPNLPSSDQTIVSPPSPSLTPNLPSPDQTIAPSPATPNLPSSEQAIAPSPFQLSTPNLPSSDQAIVSSPSPSLTPNLPSPDQAIVSSPSTPNLPSSDQTIVSSPSPSLTPNLANQEQAIVPPTFPSVPNLPSPDQAIVSSPSPSLTPNLPSPDQAIVLPTSQLPNELLSQVVLIKSDTVRQLGILVHANNSGFRTNYFVITDGKNLNVNQTLNVYSIATRTPSQGQVLSVKPIYDNRLALLKFNSTQQYSIVQPSSFSRIAGSPLNIVILQGEDDFNLVSIQAFYQNTYQEAYLAYRILNPINLLGGPILDENQNIVGIHLHPGDPSLTAFSQTLDNVLAEFQEELNQTTIPNSQNTLSRVSFDR